MADRLRTTPTRPARIVIVDDHPAIRRGLRAVITSAPDLEVRGEAAGPEDAVKVIREAGADLVLVDLSLDGISGLDLIRTIRSWDDPPPVLVISMHEEAIFAERALNAGALGYLNKAEPEEAILEGVRTVLNGQVYLSPSTTQQILDRMRGGSSRLEICGLDRLSDRELDVFARLGKGSTTRDIARDLDLSVKTVEGYRENIKRKLGIDSTPGLLRRAVVWSVLGE